MIFLFLFISFSSSSQTSLLFIGNTEPLCVVSDSTISVNIAETLPSKLEEFDALFIFSGAVSSLKPEDVEAIITFVKNGKGLYCGAENEPLQQEFHQISTILFSKSVWGNFTQTTALVDEKSFIDPTVGNAISTGETPVAVPLDVRVKVEVWVDDEPLITSYELEQGKIVFDGGYSRFYCDQLEENKGVFESIVRYLTKSN